MLSVILLGTLIKKSLPPPKKNLELQQDRSSKKFSTSYGMKLLPLEYQFQHSNIIGYFFTKYYLVLFRQKFQAKVEAL
jgi:hypothetical protein